MYLKSIEVQGFKSFAHKIKFEFHNGVTAIVGPNGSGKSNVSDAVRWVFGEQSAKQLRSSTMQDVIFAGTQLRKPQSFAEVTITLDNADRAIQMDCDEVSVTRKVYRSGDSEYRLNGSICRLKDINELFYDTGIGKEGYSIIGQGQVEKILSGKAEERRELFDEACGIVKFKKRKNEAVKKLDSEHQNMLRITDILGELEHQVGPLKKQSENAKEYLRLRDELKSYDINAFLLDSDTIEKALKKVEENLEISNAQLEEKKAEEADLKKRYVDVDDNIQTIEWKIDTQRSRVTEADQEKADCKKQIELAEERIKSETAQRKHFSERIEELNQNIQLATAKNDADQKESERLSAEITLEEDHLLKKNGEIEEKNTEISLYESKIDESNLHVIDILNEKSEAHAEFERLKETIAQSELRLKEAEDDLVSLSDTQKQVVENREAAKKEIIGIQDELISKNDEKTELSELSTSAKDDYDRITVQLTDAQEKYQIQRGRLESLRAIQERYEGFNAAVKRVMDLKPQDDDICGTVADLIKVEKKYQTLIETALGGNFQNIIVETESKAKELVNYLKENRFGRATFLPLDGVKPSGGISDAKILREEGVIGTCDTLVEADVRYSPAIRYLLERFLAVDTMDNGLKLAKKYHYTLRIVTLEGEFLNVGGSITGGSFKSTANVLNRADELVTCEKEIATLGEQIEKLRKKQNQFKQVRDSYLGELEDLEEEIHEIELKLAGLKAKYDSYDLEATLRDLEIKELSRKKAETEELLVSSKAKHDAIETAVKNLESLNAESSDSAQEVRGLLEKVKKEVSVLLQEKEEITAKISEMNQKLAALTTGIEERDAQMQKDSDEKALLNDKLTTSEETEEEIHAEIDDLNQKLSTFSDHDEGLMETLKLLQEEKERLMKSQRDYFEKRDAISEVVATLQKEIFRLESQQEKAEEKLQGLTDYLWNEYEMTPSEAKEYKDVGMDGLAPAEIRKHAHELKAAIKALGNININAIEDYKEVSERYEFLKKQYDDIMKAENSLKDIIEDLNNGMRKQFEESYTKIQTEFDVVFKELFGGGTGTFMLQQGVDPIESDIAIISQPPGKKLQNMMQLSGGEKALTAIALIFAIQRLKPSPFCLLDEIEAALDDSNVVRFANYVKTLTQKTQYIVITHRRGTMVAADRLYGITMQEKGVSALVSVNLVEKDLDQ